MSADGASGQNFDDLFGPGLTLAYSCNRSDDPTARAAGRRLIEAATEGDVASRVRDCWDQAVRLRNERDLHHALDVARLCDVQDELLNRVVALFPEDWHHVHEHLIDLIDDLPRSPVHVATLLLAGVWEPPGYEANCAAIERKAVYMLRETPGLAATHALRVIAQLHPDPVVHDEATRFLAER